VLCFGCKQDPEFEVEPFSSATSVRSARSSPASPPEQNQSANSGFTRGPIHHRDTTYESHIIFKASVLVCVQFLQMNLRLFMLLQTGGQTQAPERRPSSSQRASAPTGSLRLDRNSVPFLINAWVLLLISVPFV
jgi:hypothetical protein